MKSWIATLLCLAALSGCASEYLVVTRDGQVFSSDGKPNLGNDTGMFELEDHEGRKQQIPQTEVKQILER
ncbi:YgdI/YgdR family lipoprotein [Pseudomonas sp. CAU 1711]|uniref:YgdI/YgdR family lipoprotein n=1 Tax=Pseudomonas sp. CAU 1711 TaxID=3140356 RepID=UPI0032603173